MLWLIKNANQKKTAPCLVQEAVYLSLMRQIITPHHTLHRSMLHNCPQGDTHS